MSKKSPTSLFGIEQINGYFPAYYVDLALWAKERYKGAIRVNHQGQQAMAMSSPDEDIVTMGAAAAAPICETTEKKKISTLLVATESGIDQSKAAGLFMKSLLDLPDACRVVELKQACYSATAALQLAIGLLHIDPTQKTLIIATDIARYRLGSSAENTQGAGAIALLVSATPHIAVVNAPAGYYSQDVADFWRPSYMPEPMVDGPYSCSLFTDFLLKTWELYQQKSQETLQDSIHYCYHTPLPRLVRYAHRKLLQQQEIMPTKTLLEQHLAYGLQLNRQLGNTYTASLFFNLLSTLCYAPTDLGGQQLGCYSYGAGAVAEFFSLTVAKDYQRYLPTTALQRLLDRRKSLDMTTYKAWHAYQLPQDGTLHTLPILSDNRFRLTKIDQHQRYYQRVKEVE